MLQILFIKNDIRSYDTAALVTVRNAFLGCNVFYIELLTAVHAVVSVYGTMELDNALAAGFLVKIIDILSDDSLELTLSLKSYESLVSLIRPCIRIDELTLIKIIEIFRMLHEEIVCDDIYWSVFGTALSIIDSGTASEIRDSALGRYTCSAKEHDIFRLFDQLFELLYLVLTDTSESVNSRFHKYTSINEHREFRRRQDQRLRGHRDHGTCRLHRTFPCL